MPYTPVGWKDHPSEDTPLSAANLNHMDNQIKENTEKLDEINPSDYASKAAVEQINNKIGSVPTGSTVEGQINELNSEMANKVNQLFVGSITNSNSKKLQFSAGARFVLIVNGGSVAANCGMYNIYAATNAFVNSPIQESACLSFDKVGDTLEIRATQTVYATIIFITGENNVKMV